MSSSPDPVAATVVAVAGVEDVEARACVTD
jgi:hypothetical protein